ncbi:hypothetical protein LSAT2_024251 [Lamellibrachia satsuma]|nr:hypothetical protein LSAT2_024251 [Lamellibrachia satsuma]
MSCPRCHLTIAVGLWWWALGRSLSVMLFSGRKSGRPHKFEKKASVPRWHDNQRRPSTVLLQPSSAFTAVRAACVLFRLLRVVALSLLVRFLKTGGLCDGFDVSAFVELKL